MSEHSEGQIMYNTYMCEIKISGAVDNSLIILLTCLYENSNWARGNYV